MSRVIDLFSGCGGMSLGFMKAGFDIVAAVDYWGPAVETYRSNFKTHPIHEIDLNPATLQRHYELFKQLKPDGIIGGPPCQDFSHAGKRDESLGRSELTISFARIISEVRPSWFVMENVPRIATSRTLQVALKTIRAAGYGITIKVLDASLCGVPQKRMRFVMIGERGGEDNALLQNLEKGLTEKPTTVRDYLGNSLGLEHYYRHPRNYSRRAIYSIDEPAATVRGVNRPVAPNYPGHSTDSASVSKNIRALTTAERALIQTFPKSFLFKGSKSEVEQMIGNAVPVKLAEHVANAVKSRLAQLKNGSRARLSKNNTDKSARSKAHVFVAM